MSSSDEVSATFSTDAKIRVGVIKTHFLGTYKVFELGATHFYSFGRPLSDQSHRRSGVPTPLPVAKSYLAAFYTRVSFSAPSQASQSAAVTLDS